VYVDASERLVEQDRTKVPLTLQMLMTSHQQHDTLVEMRIGEGSAQCVAAVHAAVAVH
jgi:hypothetical protein